VEGKRGTWISRNVIYSLAHLHHLFLLTRLPVSNHRDIEVEEVLY
jgi:hypothetical protein